MSLVLNFSRNISSGLFAVCMLAATGISAQTADEIAGKYVEAIGGRDVIGKVTSLSMEGSTSVMGNDAPTTVTVLNGKGYKNEMEFNGSKIIQSVNEKGGWAINPMSGADAQAMPDEAYKAGREQMFVGGPLFDYAAKGNTLTLQGKEDNSYKIAVVNKDKIESTYFIDTATYLINKIVRKGMANGQETTITIKYSNYKKTDKGLVVPYQADIDLGQFQLTTVYSRVDVNKAVDPSVFVMPK